MENKSVRSARIMFEEFQKNTPFSMSEENRPIDIEEAYAIQNEYMSLHANRDPKGFSGYKIAFTTEVMQKHFGMDQPAYGRILTSNVYQSPHYLNSADFGRLGVECEIAITIGKDINLKSGDINKDIVYESVESIALSYEIIDPRQNKMDSMSTFDIISMNVGGAGVLLGDQIDNWKDIDIPKEGRMVQCSNCSQKWFQEPTRTQDSITSDIDKNVSEMEFEASDGKTYRFLGSQWAEVLPSGKTGLFARKKIGMELDQITGRKAIKTTRKKKKKLEEVDPSSGDYSNDKKLPDIYKEKNGLGFFGYIFLIIIVGFSVVGMLKTFEGDLINSFPEIEYIFDILNEQLEFVAESVKNLIVIISDLINSY